MIVRVRQKKNKAIITAFLLLDIVTINPPIDAIDAI